MKMRDVEARRVRLAQRDNPTVAELNELRDCEITLGMTMAGPEARSQAARRVELKNEERCSMRGTKGAMSRHAPRSKVSAGFIGSRADGTAIPMLSAEIYKILRAKAATHPDMERYPLRELFQKLSEGQETLNEDEVHRLRQAARHPDFRGEIHDALLAAADLHEQAAKLDEEEGLSGHPRPSHARIKSDVDRVLRTTRPPQRKRRKRL